MSLKLPDDPFFSTPIPTKSGEDVQNLRKTALNLESGSKVIHQHRTLFVEQQQGRKKLIEHHQPIYNDICSGDPTNTKLNQYGRDLLNKYKLACSEQKAPWEIHNNPCYSLRIPQQLEDQAENYAICGFKRSRFSGICVKYGDPSHQGAISKQKDQEQICINKIRSILIPPRSKPVLQLPAFPSLSAPLFEPARTIRRPLRISPAPLTRRPPSRQKRPIRPTFPASQIPPLEIRQPLTLKPRLTPSTQRPSSPLEPGEIRLSLSSTQPKQLTTGPKLQLKSNFSPSSPDQLRLQTNPNQLQLASGQLKFGG